MSKEVVQGVVLGVAIGGVLGFFIGRSAASAEAPVSVASVAKPNQAPAQMPPPLPSLADLQAHIAQLELITQQQPKDANAWIALGNACFDAHQAQKSVDAYAKALLLDPKNAAVLTDQGVMFRELKAFDKAIANFEAAQKVEPDHIQSLVNLGVVYGQDLGKKDKARKAYLRVIEKHPGTPQAEEAKVALEHLK